MNATLEGGPTALYVNGTRRETRAAPETPLIHVLRNDFGLAGTRFGCGTEQCGACVVLSDGKPIFACSTPVGSIAGRYITTVEGLSASGRPHPVQQALIDADAAQCGYCVSGIVIRAVALLEARPEPTEEEVRAALDPHLCRCGSHNRIVGAVLAGARAAREIAR